MVLYRTGFWNIPGEAKVEYAIVPLSDILGMGKEARLNTPGTVGSPNWEWRMPDGDRIEAGLKKYAGHLV